MLDMKQEISTEIKQELVKQALAARKFAYVPYSKFRVGAAVLAVNINVLLSIANRWNFPITDFFIFVNQEECEETYFISRCV